MSYSFTRPFGTAGGLALLISSFLPLQPASAQATDDNAAPEPVASASGRESYLPEDFARFAPRNALDMLENVPGFNVEQEDDARGLGQASGNILVNGERLSSKSTNASTQLSRIPAANVIRIDIVDGATLDIPGLSGRVANIVAESSGISGQFEWIVQTPTDYAVIGPFEGKISVSGSTGPVDYTVALNNSGFRGGNGGPNIFTDGAGELIELREGFSRTISDSPKLSGSFRFDGPGSSIANLNASYQWKIFNSRERDDLFRPGMPDALITLRNRNPGYNYEISGDFEFALGPGRLKLIGLEQFEHSDFSTQEIIDFFDGAPSIGDRFELVSDSGERIARAEYRWPMLGGDWQLAGEAAFNRLDNAAGLFMLDPAGEFVGGPFAPGTGGVTEDRYEAILSYGRALTGALSMQLALGGEYSKIAQTGTNAEQRSFRRPKGSASFAWAAGAGLDVSLELRRAVGQLDFGDFLAEVNLEAGNSNAGNSQLVPQQSWEAEIEVSKDFGGWGSATLSLFQHEIEDYVTIVPLPGGRESLGNIDGARLRGVELTGTLQLDELGMAGAKFDLDLKVQGSKLTDPVTGEDRDLDNLQRRNFRLDFRHDVPRSDWAWGLEFRDTQTGPYYRLGEVGFDYQIPTFGGAFVEHKDLLGLTAKLRAANLLGSGGYLERTVHDGPRDEAPILFNELRDGKVGYFWQFSLKGNF